jgi:hypothetical protein
MDYFFLKIRRKGWIAAGKYEDAVSTGCNIGDALWERLSAVIIED